MIIMGITGAIDWDGNDPVIQGDVDPWVHGSGITLFENEKHLVSVSEERFSRIKHDGNYPELSIKKVFNEFNIKNEDVDYVCYVSGVATPAYPKLFQTFEIQNTFKRNFPKAEFILCDHHMAHAYASFCSSPYEDSNIITFDGAGNFFHVDLDIYNLSYMLIPDNFTFSIGNKQKGIANIHHSYHPFDTFNYGTFYNSFSAILYNKILEKKDIFEINHNERETYPGKIMGLAGYGDYTKIDFPDPFYIEKSNLNFDVCRIKTNKNFVYYHFANELMSNNINAFDAAAWLQYQFEKYFLLFLENIHPLLKKDYLCLGGGCALNIILNSKILENKLFKDVHVNTAPNDDGLSFGAACSVVKNVLNKIPMLPDNQGCLGLEYTELDIENSLNKLNIKHA